MTKKDSLPPAPPIDAVLEAALYTTDLDAAEAFYGGVLELEEVVRVDGRHIFYRVGATILLIFNPEATKVPTDNPRLPVPAHGATGKGHLCFAATREQMAAWADRLTAAGHPIEADFEWPNGARSIYFRDPAGNSLEMAEPRLWS
ncbi:VOC family protein [Roseovarius aestuariivivens]|uniref:VOC family protein n=1 Tax=Roseovarius aestuariivivens TaxID=1888910 RepID=UPI00107FE39E|nr:VOC family protein [Roseovarius aestuariivivens]